MPVNKILITIIIILITVLGGVWFYLTRPVVIDDDPDDPLIDRRSDAWLLERNGPASVGALPDTENVPEELGSGVLLFDEFGNPVEPDQDTIEVGSPPDYAPEEVDTGSSDLPIIFFSDINEE